MFTLEKHFISMLGVQVITRIIAVQVLAKMDRQFQVDLMVAGLVENGLLVMAVAVVVVVLRIYGLVELH